MTDKATYKVDGMTCGGCVGSVTRALKTAGVDAEVSLEDGTATVPASVDSAVVRQAVEEAGFDYAGKVTTAS